MGEMQEPRSGRGMGREVKQEREWSLQHEGDTGSGLRGPVLPPIHPREILISSLPRLVRPWLLSSAWAVLSPVETIWRVG